MAPGWIGLITFTCVAVCRHYRGIGLDSYTLVDVYASLDVTENFTLGLYAKNLFDQLAVYDGIGTFQDPESIVSARPRTFGISGRLRF